MVRAHPDPPTHAGAVAQLGEHLLCKQGVVGSIPSSSTSFPGKNDYRLRERVQRSSVVSSQRGSRLEIAAPLFNNSEGKASMGLMRARGR